jgi:hypothetical protein
MRYIIALTGAGLLCSMMAVATHAQGIRGRLTDAGNNPVSYAAVYDESTFTGTTSNAEGYYELKLDPGQHSVVYRAMGYYQVRKSLVTDKTFITLNIQLQEQAIQVKEVVITPGKEDPAYGIMRKVISLAPYHLNLVAAYTADVYLRGTIRLIHIPKIIAKHTEINGQKNVLKSGDVFLQESMNQIRFKAPDLYEQKVLSYHSTFPGDNNDVNPMEIIRSSFYQPRIDEFISPLAPHAFSYYTYRYEGFFEEGEHVVFKIKVTPKRNSQQLMKGYLYVVDKLWCLHTADATVHMFFGDLRYNTIYSAVRNNAWLPIGYQFYVNADIMGIKADYKYSGSVKFREVVLNEKNVLQSSPKETPLPDDKPVNQEKQDPRKQKNEQEIEQLLSKEELTNRDMVKLAALMAKEAPTDTAVTRSLEIIDNAAKVTIEKDALKKDTAYWNTMRPIPLTNAEALIPGIIDTTLNRPVDSIPEADSAKVVRKPSRAAKVANFITSGTAFWAFDSTLRIRYDGLIGFKKVDFNTVDGFIFRQTFGLEQRIDSIHTLKVYPGVAYGFSREQWMWWTDMHYDYWPMRMGKLHLHIGSVSVDYNGETGIHPTLNSLTSLFFRRNYQKLYHRKMAFVSNSVDLANGLNLSVLLGYQTAMPLDNYSDYSFFYQDEREYSANLPSTDQDDIDRNLYNKEAYWDVSLAYTPQYYYRVRDGHKHYLHSKYPTLFIRNRMALPEILGSTAKYNLLEVGVRQEKEWGIMHGFFWSIKGGWYLNQDRIFLMDDKYFNNQDLPVNVGNFDEAFRLVPYYRNATTETFAEAHARFSTPYLLVKYLPFLSNKLWRENLHLHYLTSDQTRHYWEIGYSISQIYLVGSIGIFAGFNGTAYQSYGVQVTLQMD